jgi:hypothetical protein
LEALSKFSKGNGFSCSAVSQVVQTDTGSSSGRHDFLSKKGLTDELNENQGNIDTEVENLRGPRRHQY